MKRFLLMGVFCIAAMAAMAESPAVVFTTTDGAKHSVSIQGLDITFANGNMIVKNNETTLTLPLAEMATMEFDGIATVIAEKSIAIDSTVSVSSLDGKFAGKFDNMREVAASLPAGIYVVKTTTGETVKIMLSK